MGKLGRDMAALVGPPDEEDAADGGADEDTEDAKGGQEEAEVSAMGDYRETLKTGTDEEALASLKTLLDLIG